MLNEMLLFRSPTTSAGSLKSRGKKKGSVAILAVIVLTAIALASPLILTAGTASRLVSA